MTDYKKINHRMIKATKHSLSVVFSRKTTRNISFIPAFFFSDKRTMINNKGEQSMGKNSKSVQKQSKIDSKTDISEKI